MLQNKKTSFRTPLDAAIAHLKGSGVIRRDNDVAEDIGYTKSVVSGYKSGNAKISSDFIKKFENHYKIRLSDFGGGQQKEMAERSGVSLSELSRTLRRIENGQAYIRAEIRGYGQYQIMQQVAWDQKKFLEAMDKVGRIVGANLSADDLQDSGGGS